MNALTNTILTILGGALILLTGYLIDIL